MQKMPYPNRLRALIKDAGLNIREVHRETGIPESTLRWWASGNGVIPSRERATLARVIACDIHDLAPLHGNELRPPLEEEPATNIIVSDWNGPQNRQTGSEERVVVGKMYGKERIIKLSSCNVPILLRSTRTIGLLRSRKRWTHLG